VAAWRRWKWSKLSEGQREVIRDFNNLAPDDRAALKRELSDRSEEKFLRKSQAEFFRQDRKKQKAHRKALPGIRKEHERWVKSLLDEKK
jgi:hypothetical protein